MEIIYFLDLSATFSFAVWAAGNILDLPKDR
jgi:hypothetical protein